MRYIGIGVGIWVRQSVIGTAGTCIPVESICPGGVKIDPSVIDQFLVDYPGVIDGATCGVSNSKQLLDIELAVALVVDEGFNMGELKRKLLHAFDSSRCPTLFFQVKKIPRNAMGKVMRIQLANALEEAVKR